MISLDGDIRVRIVRRRDSGRWQLAVESDQWVAPGAVADLALFVDRTAARALRDAMDEVLARADVEVEVARPTVGPDTPNGASDANVEVANG
jgi:hypothetical protein